jgi:hypothetical protein
MSGSWSILAAAATPAEVVDQWASELRPARKLFKDFHPWSKAKIGSTLPTVGSFVGMLFHSSPTERRHLF